MASISCWVNESCVRSSRVACDAIATASLRVLATAQQDPEEQQRDHARARGQHEQREAREPGCCSVGSSSNCRRHCARHGDVAACFSRAPVGTHEPAPRPPARPAGVEDVSIERRGLLRDRAPPTSWMRMPRPAQRRARSACRRRCRRPAAPRSRSRAGNRGARRAWTGRRRRTPGGRSRARSSRRSPGPGGSAPSTTGSPVSRARSAAGAARVAARMSSPNAASLPAKRLDVVDDPVLVAPPGGLDVEVAG